MANKRASIQRFEYCSRLTVVAALALFQSALPALADDVNGGGSASSQNGPWVQQAAPSTVFEINARLVPSARESISGMPASMIDAGDLNGDGEPDLVLLLDEVAEAKTRRVMQAMSVKGEVIWKQAAPINSPVEGEASLVTPTGLWSIPDLTGDDCRDVCVASTADAGQFAILNGATGQVKAVLTEERPHYLALANVFPATSESVNHLIFATLPHFGRDDSPDRIGISLVATDSFKQIASYNQPFKRFDSDARFVLGGLVSNDDGDRTPVFLATGKSKARRQSAPKQLVAAIYGRSFDRVRYASMDIDLSQPGVQVEIFDSKPADKRFPTMAVLQRGDETPPSKITVLNPADDKPRWTLSTDDAAWKGLVGHIMRGTDSGTAKGSSVVADMSKIAILPEALNWPKGGLAVELMEDLHAIAIFDPNDGAAICVFSLGGAMPTKSDSQSEWKFIRGADDFWLQVATPARNGKTSMRRFSCTSTSSAY